MPLGSKFIATDHRAFAEQYIHPERRLYAALATLQEKYDFNIPDPLPFLADPEDQSDLVMEVQTKTGEKIKVTVPYNGAPLIECSSFPLKFDLELYRQKVMRMFRT